MDFYRIAIEEKKDGTFRVYPDWKVGRSEDLMTRGGSFYAIWDEGRQTWSTDIYDVVRLVDADLKRFAAEQSERTGLIYRVAKLQSHGSGIWDNFQRYLRNSGKNYHALDEKLIFANDEPRKIDYSSHRLPYAMATGSIDAWDTIVGTLYDESERAKIEWAIGAVISGESKRIQKFLVFYGAPGTGKSTVLNIIGDLFEGYTSVFDAQELVGNNNSFATSSFKDNPLVGIQHDGNLSRISDNTKLNSIVSHEIMIVNEKYQRPVEQRSNAFLFMGTNLPVKITDAKSGIIRRLIDVVPTGRKLEHDFYFDLMERVGFELGAIAAHCLGRYLAMGKNYYGSYRPTEMMLQTDPFYNFIEAYLDIFSSQEGMALKQAWELYKQYCDESNTEKRLQLFKFREELRNYFWHFEDRVRIDGQHVRSYYSGFKGMEPTPPIAEIPSKPEGLYRIELTEQTSVFDEVYSAQPAQYYDEAEDRPEHKWANNPHTLADLDTSKLHYVQIPEAHIVIDFDLRDETGEKNLALNIEAASKWPPTYTEVSRSGNGIHLHYIYNGDVTSLAAEFAPHIEIKTLLGGSSLRRQLTLCNNMNIAPMAGGLPKKELKPVLDKARIMSEKGLRAQIEKNLRKEIHPGTKPSVDFIKHILDEAYEDGLPYDVSDMRARITAFAARSTNHAAVCIGLVQKMKFASEVKPEEVPEPVNLAEDGTVIFYDVEVFPNLFVVCWKAQGNDTVVRMINPSPQDVEMLFAHKLIGFNNRRYDNHILWARFMGYSIEGLYHLSQKIINGDNNRDVLFGQAYNLSYADIFDYLAGDHKKGLKKLQIQLGIHHAELDLPWDEPVPEEKWSLVADYCCNDVVSTEVVFDHFKQDFVARQMMAKLSGLSVNHTTLNHTARIIFGEDRDPQGKFVYTDLSEMFPGYVHDGGVSTYRGEETGQGGYVYAEPGAYDNVAVLDVASMHPTSIIELNAFGPYTGNFKDLLDARLAIKRKDFDAAGKMLDGKLLPFLLAPNAVRADAGEEMYDYEGAAALAYALKIVINIVYGLTSASFQNQFKDPRNTDNIVAKRGALFMIDLKHAVQEKGFQVVHIKTDSIKIPNATSEIIDFVTTFGEGYGYTFEHEKTYTKFCLVNDAVFVAHDAVKKEWEAVGAQFQHPFVFKTLFSHEDIGFDDYCETKNVTKGTMYLEKIQPGTPDRMHVGRTGSFVPVISGGGTLIRAHDEKDYAVSGTKGYQWVTREVARMRLEDGTLEIDMRYFETLIEKARAAIETYVQDFEALLP